MRTKTYVKWDSELVAQALELLRKHGPALAAQRLGVSRNSLRDALRVRGHKVSMRTKIKLKKQAKRTRAFVKPAENPMRPFIAMAAIEADKGGCRYPLGDLDKENFRYCGRDVNRKGYCAAHEAKMHIPRSAGWSQASYEKWQASVINGLENADYENC